MKLFATRTIPGEGRQLLLNAGIEVEEHTEKRALSRDELIAKCRQADALMCIGRHELDAVFMQACPNLKVISLFSVGYDHVDLEAAKKQSIQVGNTPDVLTNATADTAFLLMQAVARNAFQSFKTIEKGEWGFFDPSANLGQELTGKTLGIFGLGKIGFEMARKAKAAFGMPIIYHNRSKNAQAEKELAAQHVDFETLLQQSDVLSVNANLSPSTQGIFNAAAFQKMKPTAIFINTARGGVHNQEGLIQALTQGEIWGAGLDVTSPEPMDANDPLLQMQRVCILPHIGSATYTARFAMARLAVQNAIAALNGEQMPHEV